MLSVASHGEKQWLFLPEAGKEGLERVVKLMYVPDFSKGLDMDEKIMKKWKVEEKQERGGHLKKNFFLSKNTVYS